MLLLVVIVVFQTVSSFDLRCRHPISGAHQPTFESSYEEDLGRTQKYIISLKSLQYFASFFHRPNKLRRSDRSRFGFLCCIIYDIILMFNFFLSCGDRGHGSI